MFASITLDGDTWTMATNFDKRAREKAGHRRLPRSQSERGKERFGCKQPGNRGEKLKLQQSGEFQDGVPIPACATAKLLFQFGSGQLRGADSVRIDQIRFTAVRIHAFTTDDDFAQAFNLLRLEGLFAEEDEQMTRVCNSFFGKWILLNNLFPLAC